IRGPRGTHGFTLIETVIAMLLLAIMSIMGYQAVEVVLGANQRSQAGLADEMALQRAWQIIGNDLIHMRARPFADGLGGIEPAYQTGLASMDLLRMTRGGGASLRASPSGLSRITYSVSAEGELLRSAGP